MSEWIDDTELGGSYQQLTFDLGSDPDEEGDVFATLVKAPRPRTIKGAVLYLHGFTDYFFQTHVADFFTDRGYAFYALDMRKCGRSRRDGQTAHFISDLAYYDVELDEALAAIREETDSQVIVMGHSTGGLIAPLWISRLIEESGSAAEAGLAGLILNSPWFDLQGADWMRTIGTRVIRALASVRPKEVVRDRGAGVYGTSLSATEHGEWTYNTDFKPPDSLPITAGWLTAVRRGQAEFHEGLDVEVPSLVLRSARSWFSKSYGPKAKTADTVLDVKQIARWSGCLGAHTWVVPIENAMHDVFLSTAEVRDEAFDVVDDWMRDRGLL